MVLDQDQIVPYDPTGPTEMNCTGTLLDPDFMERARAWLIEKGYRF
jgi:hypothetical protein